MHHYSVQFSSVAQSCLTLCDPMNRSTPGLSGHHQLLEFTQTHAHRVGDAIQPSHPLSSPFPPAPKSRSFPMSQLFAWGGQSIGVSALASVIPMNTQDWSPLEWTGWISLRSKGLSGDSGQDSANSLQRAQVQSLVGELRSHESQGQKNIVPPIKLRENKLILHVFKKLFE